LSSAAIGLVLDWNWIVTVGIAPAVYLTCTIMMGSMMWSMLSNEGSNQA